MSETSSVDLTNYETSDLVSFLTDVSAANKVKNLIEEENNDELKLRVFVSGGGVARDFNMVSLLTRTYKTATQKLKKME